jgi:plastocyanin domain-containing protein
MTIRIALVSLALAACSSGGASRAAQDGRATVTVDGDGYHPARLEVVAGRPLRITFRRTTDRTCGQEVVFPDLGIRRELPLDRPVDVTLTPTRGTIAFTCGMGMYQGSIVAE